MWTAAAELHAHFLNSKGSSSGLLSPLSRDSSGSSSYSSANGHPMSLSSSFRTVSSTDGNSSLESCWLSDRWAASGSYYAQPRLIYKALELHMDRTNHRGVTP